MKQEFVNAVESHFGQTNTPQSGSAPKNAGLHFVGIKSIKPLGKQPVYNMEVDEYHNFSVNGGIIVHNCMDSVRYFAQTILRKEIR